MAEIFISYAHADGADAAEGLKSILIAAGHNVWLDKNGLNAGSQWSHEIE